MKNALQLKAITNLLFVKLLTSFLVVIILFVALNSFIFSFFKSEMHDEIIKYNLSNMNNTVEEAESYLYLIKKLGLSILSDDKIELIYSQITDDYGDINYRIVGEITQMLRNITATNEFFYIENIFLYYKNRDVVIEMEGINDSHTMFSKFLVSQAYDSYFWKRQFHTNYFYRIFPSDVFKEFVANRSVLLSSKRLIPVVIKNKVYANSYVVILLNANSLFGSLHESIYDNFIIMDEDNQLVYFSGKKYEYPLPKFPNTEGFVRSENKYFFYKKSNTTGMTYVNVIPYDHLNEKISKYNLISTIILCISVIIGAAASILFSMRINNPVKRIIESIKQFQNSLPIRTNIKEFDEISQKIIFLLRSNQSINRTLEKKDSILRNFILANNIKNIRSDPASHFEFSFHKRPFQFILFDITFLKSVLENDEVQSSRAVLAFREFIHSQLDKHADETITFQVESRQILSMVFLKETENITTGLRKIHQILELDKEFCFFTIVISSVYHNSTDITKAYKQVLRMLQQRKLNDDTQIITEEDPEQSNIFITPNQEQEFHVHLMNGSLQESLVFIERVFNHMHRKRALANQYKEISILLYKKMKQALTSMNIDFIEIEKYEKELMHCHTLDEYKQLMHSLTVESVEMVGNKKEEQDQIITFVVDYFEKNYAEDLSLDIVAEKLMISGGYLSTYFKEKTGINFSDYLNTLRMDKAKQFLRDPRLSVQNVAKKVGYYNMNSFTRMFKKTVGMTPGDYRKRIQSPN
jgi:two-component system response regulator YesN